MLPFVHFYNILLLYAYIPCSKCCSCPERIIEDCITSRSAPLPRHVLPSPIIIDTKLSLIYQRGRHKRVLWLKYLIRHIRIIQSRHPSQFPIHRSGSSILLLLVSIKPNSKLPVDSLVLLDPF